MDTMRPSTPESMTSRTFLKYGATRDCWNGASILPDSFAAAIISSTCSAVPANGFSLTTLKPCFRRSIATGACM